MYIAQNERNVSVGCSAGGPCLRRCPRDGHILLLQNAVPANHIPGIFAVLTRQLHPWSIQ